jgi:cysteine dioxygenase
VIVFFLDLVTSLRTIVTRDGARLRSRARFTETDYHRELVGQRDGAEIWLLSWLPGQITPIHDHGGAHSACTVLSGELYEERFVRRRGRTVDVGGMHRRPGMHDLIGLDVIHRVRPLVPTISLHVVIPGAEGMTYAEAA